MITGAFTSKGNIAYYHCNRWPGKELAIGGLRTKVLSARLMNGPKVRFVQTDDRLVLRGLPAEVPNSLATVIELECDDVPVQVLGAGHVLIDDDPWRHSA
jgi:alpha-L-fucosidase